MEATDRGMFMSTKTLRLVPWFIPSTTTSLLCLWETGAPQRLGPLEGSCDIYVSIYDPIYVSTYDQTATLDQIEIAVPWVSLQLCRFAF